MATIQRRRIKPASPPPVEDESLGGAVGASGHNDPAGDVEGEDLEEAVTPRPAMRATRTDTRDAGREPVHVAKRTRRRKSTITENLFDIPIDEIPEGSSYEWKRHSVNGQEDPFYLAQLREQGWEPVNPKLHPSWLPPGYNQPHIIKGGQILMERPLSLTQEARAENRQLARRQMREAEQRLGMTPKGELSREHPDLKNRVVKEVGRMVSQQSIEE